MLQTVPFNPDITFPFLTKVDTRVCISPWRPSVHQHHKLSLPPPVLPAVYNIVRHLSAVSGPSSSWLDHSAASSLNTQPISLIVASIKDVGRQGAGNGRSGLPESPESWPCQRGRSEPAAAPLWSPPDFAPSRTSKRGQLDWLTSALVSILFPPQQGHNHQEIHLR